MRARPWLKERPNADSLRLQLSTLSSGEPDVRRLPARYRKEVLLFVEFLEYLANSGLADDSSEDADLWQAVLSPPTLA